jgi:hypothetical protein
LVLSEKAASSRPLYAQVRKLRPRDTYGRNDLTYRDETMPSRFETKKCGGSDRAFGAAK